MDDYFESAEADLSRRYTAILVSTYTDGVAQGIFRDDLPVTLVRDLVFGSIEHIAWGVLNGSQTIDPDSTAEMLMSIICSGIEKSGEHSSELQRLEKVTARLEELTGSTDKS